MEVNLNKVDGDFTPHSCYSRNQEIKYTQHISVAKMIIKREREERYVF